MKVIDKLIFCIHLLASENFLVEGRVEVTFSERMRHHCETLAYLQNKEVVRSEMDVADHNGLRSSTPSTVTVDDDWASSIPEPTLHLSTQTVLALSVMISFSDMPVPSVNYLVQL